MGAWAAPAAAVGFWVGLLAAGLDPRPMGGPVLLVAGGSGLAATALWGRSPRTRSRWLVAGAGLELLAEPHGPRERILAAAGFPGEGRDAGPGGWTAPRRIVAVAACALLGAGWIGLRASFLDRLGDLEGRFVELIGTAASDARRFDWGWGVEVAVKRAVVDGRPVPLDLRTWVSGSGPAPPVEAGQPVAGDGTLQRVGVAGTGFDRYLVSRGIEATASVEGMSVRGPPENAALRLAGAARGALRRGAAAALKPREAGLLLGLSIGDTTRLDREIEEDFRASGLSHLLAVSGSNVALVLAPALALAGYLGLCLRWRVAVGAATIGFFALLTRWEPSVLRASAMAAIALVGVWAGRPRTTGTLLGASVLVLLAADPWLAHSVGFQLSAAATAGLALLASPMAVRLSWLPKLLALAGAATASAQLGVTPLLLLHFGVVPTVTLLANLLAFPAVGVALLAGLLAASAGAAWEPLGWLIGAPAALPLDYLIELADRMARFPLPSLTGGGVVAAGVAAGLALLVAFRLRRGRRPLASLAAALSLAALAWSSAPGAGPPFGLTVTFLDVGQGDAAVVRTPEGATVLVDAGPEPGLVASKLAALGVRRIDLAVVSHRHADHVEGFPAVLARFPVALLIEPGCPGPSPPYRRLLDAIRDEEVPVRHPRGGDVLSVGRLVIEVLGPDQCSPGGLSPNDESLVLRLTYRNDVVLFTGDAEIPAQRDILADGDSVEADVLKVPHQGGDTSDPAFFEVIGASVAVVSVGPNDYGHPRPGVLAKLRSEGMAVYRTDLAGDVTVRFDPSGLLVESAGD